MKRKVLLAVTLMALGSAVYSQETVEYDNNVVPLRTVFHEIGWNALNSFTYNFGLNFIGSGLETWAFIETGLDWKWRNLAWQNKRLSNIGLPGLYIGYVLPALAPVASYITGRAIGNVKLQMAGLALTQSLLLTLAIQSPLKMITGWDLPGIVIELDHT
jgi:hypothetical protein